MWLSATFMHRHTFHLIASWLTSDYAAPESSSRDTSSSVKREYPKPSYNSLRRGVYSHCSAWHSRGGLTEYTSYDRNKGQNDRLRRVAGENCATGYDNRGHVAKNCGKISHWAVLISFNFWNIHIPRPFWLKERLLRSRRLDVAVYIYLNKK